MRKSPSCLILILLFVLGTAVSFAAETANDGALRLDTYMNLFVQDFDSTQAAATELRIERNPEKMIERYRENAKEAFLEGNYDSLKVIMENGNLYADSIHWESAFSRSEYFAVNFLMKDFESLKNVDSLPHYWECRSYDEFCQTLRSRMADMDFSHEMEMILNEIEDESDRAFVRIVLNQFVSNDKVKTTELIEKYRPQLKNKRQLYFLVENFWSKFEYDKDNYFVFSMGPAFVKMFGDVSKKVDDGFGFFLGLDWIRKGFFYEWFMNFQFNHVSEPDTLRMTDCGFDFNFGHWLVN